MAATSLETLERLAGSSDVAAPSKRMLVIVNPYATTVSDRLKHLVVYALQGRYEVDSVETQARGHATELCREAAQEGYDVVCAFGGDGTFNEAANGLAGSTTPLTCLPGGSTNVFSRILGIPSDVVDATEHLLAMADEWRPRAIDLGVVNDRRFLFTAGLGLDASVTRRVDAHPRLKARFGPWFYVTAAVERVQPRIRAARAPARRRGRRRDDRGRHRDGAEHDAVHLLRQPADRARRGRVARPTERWRASSCAAPTRSTCRPSAGAPSPPARASSATAASSTSRA